jgi:hypothetical protein
MTTLPPRSLPAQIALRIRSSTITKGAGPGGFVSLNTTPYS